ncbi:MAG: hypothetical protein VX833_03155 [Actinomycetota bacterium]|nr:hypothetical protein [Actinomycetota bacterium]
MGETIPLTDPSPMRIGYRNPHLAASENPIAHGRCDQQDCTVLVGPRLEGKRVLTDRDRQFTLVGPGHFGSLISGPYRDGKRVIWSNGRQQIVKLDYDTLEVLATLTVRDEPVTTLSEMENDVGGLDNLTGDEAISHAVTVAMRYLTGLDGVYALLDEDQTLFLGQKTGAVAYADAIPGERTSRVVERNRWEKPPEIEGYFVGLNMTPDGRIVMSTDHGWLVSLKRDFSSYEAIRLPGAAEEASDHCARMETERGNTAYGWVRTSMCCDEDGGIYVNSLNNLHKVVWTGAALSLDPADGAWSAAYRNGTTIGSGTTPSLMGFGPDQDRFVVIGDGDEVVNITLFWRDAIPDDWEQIPGAPSRRIAGIGPAHMGDPTRTAIQTEQSITVAGYGAMTVNNEPAWRPDYLPARGARMLSFLLGHHSKYSPRGLHKYEWDPAVRQLREAWVNTEVSSPNSVPSVSLGSGLVYTCGTRNGRWTIEALDWSTGESIGHVDVGDSMYNTLGAGVILDDDGRLLYGTIFGKVRLLLA